MRIPLAQVGNAALDAANQSASVPRGDDAGKNAAGIGHFVPRSE
jgi:hypothetical protein